MTIIKLNAIGSTNDFLKGLYSTQPLENFSVVVAENQTTGKGQRGSLWNTEPHKNLTFSLLIKDTILPGTSIFDLNIAISLSIIQALEKYSIPQLSIKWPNDILAEGKKIAGILIENIFSSRENVSSIIGIGINVNQTDFKDLTSASSLQNITGLTYDKESLLQELRNQVMINYEWLKNGKSELLWQAYHNYLFMRNKTATFEYPDGLQFSGQILKVLKNGKLQILLEDQTKLTFELKEIRMIY
ncbi:MAG TPA: biotin--[acetyl-CoA-carboxylase] ligase [Flavobacterium sp.]|nr:biotin--[acetyl-CoA-carboxylase] ligase [Flavobacterium sp.]